MDIEIYYFSGTGNSLAVARDIAAKINGKLISIPSVIDEPSIKTEAEIIGIVFPSYLAHLYGIPLMVERFVQKLDNIRSKSIFAVCTCGGYEIVNALPTLKNFTRLVKSQGGKTPAQFSIRLPMNNLDYDHIPIPINRDQDTMFRKCERKVQDICRRVVNRKKGRLRVIKTGVNLLLTPMYLMLRDVCITDLRKKALEPKDSKLGFRELMQLTDKSIRFDGTCSGCATCARVCPARNITMVDNRPVWQHRCEICFACDEWCPKKAIHHWGKYEGKDYHHPGVKVTDMFVQTL